MNSNVFFFFFVGLVAAGFSVSIFREFGLLAGIGEGRRRGMSSELVKVLAFLFQ